MRNKEKCGVEICRSKKNFPQLKRELSLPSKGLLIARVSERRHTWILICDISYTEDEQKILETSGESEGKY